MHALGETEPMTDANYPYRLNLVTAYAQAYRQASTQGPAAAASPARIAAEGFPHHPGRPATPAGPPAPDLAARRAQTRPGSRPGTGRRDDRTRQDQQQPHGDLMSTWTPEAIRALGVTTDLPTLGKIFRVSRTRAYQMAHTGEWEQAGIRIVPLGSRYVVAVQSVLEVLGHGDAGPAGTAGTHASGRRPVRRDDAITGRRFREPRTSPDSRRASQAAPGWPVEACRQRASSRRTYGPASAVAARSCAHAPGRAASSPNDTATRHKEREENEPARIRA